jgi:hypothetical protein
MAFDFAERRSNCSGCGERVTIHRNKIVLKRRRISYHYANHALSGLIAVRRSAVESGSCVECR